MRAGKRLKPVLPALLVAAVTAVMTACNVAASGLTGTSGRDGSNASGSGSGSGTVTTAVIEQDGGGGGGTSSDLANSKTSIVEMTPSHVAVTSNAIITSNGTTPIIVVLGGYVSCANSLGGGTPDPALQTLSGLLTNSVNALTAAGSVQPLTLVGCYGDSSSKIYYRLSTAVPSAAPQVGAVADLVQAVTTLAAGAPRPQVYLVGHSYGGWTAMAVAQLLPATVPVTMLVTLDPISVSNCTTANFLTSALNKVPDPGCLQSPTDLPNLAALAASVGVWENFWEGNCALLHSGPIDAASNVQVQEAGPGFVPHSAVAGDPFVIAPVTQLMVSRYHAAGKS